MITRRNIINGHYMFGNTFIQPEMPMYEKIVHHNMAPVTRPMPPYPDLTTRPITCPGGKVGCNLGCENLNNKLDTQYDESAYTVNANCIDCPFDTNDIVRDPLMFNVVNVETTLIKSLKVTIYGTSSEQDKSIDMKIGNRYAITYVTEHGLIMSVGRLEIISDSVPDTCTRYLNATNMSAASSAYIGMDCSTEGCSDKRKIYIATIRYIQELKDNEIAENVITTKTTKERLIELLNNIENYELIARVIALLSKAEDNNLMDRIINILSEVEQNELSSRIDNLLDEVDGFNATILE